MNIIYMCIHHSIIYYKPQTCDIIVNLRTPENGGEQHGEQTPNVDGTVEKSKESPQNIATLQLCNITCTNY